MSELREPEYFRLRKNDVLIRFNDDRTQFNLIYAVDDRIESYTTRSAKGALIIADCLIAGTDIPDNIDELTDSELN
ncbi:MAG TPA: hypothetical protein PK665_15060 [Ignavibacteriaceae bacterium]|nr:hypothetical protein [Ignavibacteriaceae bacterium]